MHEDERYHYLTNLALDKTVAEAINACMSKEQPGKRGTYLTYNSYDHLTLSSSSLK